MDNVEFCRESDQEFVSAGRQFCSVRCRETFERDTGLTVEEFDEIEEERASELALLAKAQRAHERLAAQAEYDSQCIQS